METVKKEVTNVLNVGQRITENDFKFLADNYKKYYEHGNASFVIEKELIQENLTFNENVAGIRFMYGLKDPLNPNSLVLFLIPCSSISEKGISTESMLKKEGYHDHVGNLYSLQEVALMLSQYVKSVAAENPNLVYKEITRGNFYGKNSLESLLVNDCTFIQFNFGVKNNSISPVIQPLNKNFYQLNEVFMDFSRPCPTYCNELGEEGCVATLAVASNSDGEIELNEFRYFRDYHLLELAGGAQLFELYYIISPVVAKIMQRDANNIVSLGQFYKEEITPFKLLLKEGNHQEAVYALKETLEVLLEEYDHAKVFV
mgnify:CR=1 FL=1